MGTVVQLARDDWMFVNLRDRRRDIGAMETMCRALRYDVGRTGSQCAQYSNLALGDRSPASLSLICGVLRCAVLCCAIPFYARRQWPLSYTQEGTLNI